jgi:hypothetical protein
MLNAEELNILFFEMLVCFIFENVLSHVMVIE